MDRNRLQVWKVEGMSSVFRGQRGEENGAEYLGEVLVNVDVEPLLCDYRSVEDRVHDEIWCLGWVEGFQGVK